MLATQLYPKFLSSTGVCTDTRQLRPGQLFFALKGPNFNGNKYAMQALEKGASYAVIDESPEEQDNRLLLVDDVLAALQDLARFHRRELGIPVIGITGSNGKTTNKELIAAVLSTSYRLHYTQGNLNNHIGVPLTLLAMDRDTEMAVVEMGANHQREIAALSAIALPDYGLITSIGIAHLEGFGSVEGIKKGKKELFEHVLATGGKCFINLNTPTVPGLCEGPEEQKILYGSEAHLPQYKITGQAPFLSLEIDNGNGKWSVDSRLTGSFQADNLLNAWAIGAYFKVPEEQIQAALQEYTPANNRAQTVTWQEAKVLLDAYNANPSSVKAALESFAVRPAERRMAVLGDMLELGDQALSFHQEIVDLAVRLSLDDIILIGDVFGETRAPAKARKFHNTAEAREWLKAQSLRGTDILIKGSRGMALEKILA